MSTLVFMLVLGIVAAIIVYFVLAETSPRYALKGALLAPVFLASSGVIFAVGFDRPLFDPVFMLTLGIVEAVVAYFVLAVISPRYSLKDALLAPAFLAPSGVIFAVFFYKPFFDILNWGRFKSQRNGAYFINVGMEQYREHLTGQDFRDGLVHTLQFVAYTVPAGLVLGTLLAVAANRQLKGIKIFQAIFSSTLASSVAVTSVMFFFLFNPVVGSFPLDWLERDSFSWISGTLVNPAMLEVAIPTIWQNLGLSFIIVLAGLQAVPEEVMEAARLDGYGPVRRLLRITLPLISPVLLFLLVVLVIQGFQAFPQIELISRGGPAGGTENLVYKIFQYNKPDTIGIGAVFSVGLFLITLIVTALQFAILDRRVHYAN